jgi:hypothetical protein
MECMALQPGLGAAAVGTNNGYFTHFSWVSVVPKYFWQYTSTMWTIHYFWATALSFLYDVTYEVTGWFNMFTIVIDQGTLDKIKSLGLPEKRESNQYLLIHVHGDGVKAPRNWNVKVFTNSKKRLTMVTTDEVILNNLLSGETVENKKVCSLPTNSFVTPLIPITGKTVTDFGFDDNHSECPELLIQVDDSGWGFPLGGVMIGATDGKKVMTGIIDVKYFQEGLFESKRYLDEAARITLELVGGMGATPENSRIQICPGYVNSTSYTTLRRMNYLVEKKAITGLLQNQIEKRFFDYVRALGYESYYDPKETKDIPKKFQDVINWINKDKTNRMMLAKSGWKYFKKTVN